MGGREWDGEREEQRKREKEREIEREKKKERERKIKIGDMRENVGEIYIYIYDSISEMYRIIISLIFSEQLKAIEKITFVLMFRKYTADNYI